LFRHLGRRMADRLPSERQRNPDDCKYLGFAVPYG
jgi:hypothetical protein